MAIYHTHHLIPKHAGGTDDPENLVRVTIEEHAELHRKLFAEHGRWQDELAWRTLSGQITSAEARIEAVKRALTGKKQTPEHLAKRSNKGKKFGPLSKEHKTKFLAAGDIFRSTEQGKDATQRALTAARDANLGSFWITDGINNKRLKKANYVPIGWRKGRTITSSSRQQPCTLL